MRGNLNYVNRLTLEGLLIIDVHSKDIISSLIEKKILDETAYEWISQLRYNLEKDEVHAKMITAKLKYGFEYIGNLSRLVITPLSDRCFRTLMIAKEMCQGGAIEGPAGTGKTETVKDLAKSLGNYCVIFNGSDELDHLAMAKFFKGIASAGAWCCFDEFNRIDLEVLSVIASQVLMIFQALSSEQSVFHFIGEDVNLNRQCAINITMNPVAICRTTLPDNLKGLFRPCAMTLPDFALIAEILLYSYGFHEARVLSKKVVACLRLCSEQLSAQEHYDFGLRALHSIVTTARELQKKFANEKEEILVLKALNAANLPKLTAHDIPFYEGIASDLFPTIESKEKDNENLRKALEDALQIEKLQPKRQFIKKCLDLYETSLVRHGVIIIGEPFSGKTQAIRSLKKALLNLKEVDNMPYANMVVRTLNPKAIDFKQLYGSYDGEARVWTDGVLPIIIKEFTEMESPDMKLLVFDGPVDVAWMESMNTVLDDNKKLCLSSGSVIKLKPNLRMFFEVEELKHASLAIVSRCGIVYMESAQLGWDVLTKSYCDTLPTVLLPKKTKIEDLIVSVLKPTLAFVMKQCKFPLPMKPMHLVQNFLNLFESFISECRSPTYKLSADMDGAIPNIIIFSLVWSFGGCIEQAFRERFHEYIIDMMNLIDIKMKYKLEFDSDNVMPKFNVKLPENENIFELEYDRKKNVWRNWKISAGNYFDTLNKDIKFHEIIVPTTESIRNSYLLRLLLRNGKNLLLLGPTGTAKTICTIAELKKNFYNSQYTYLNLCMSAQTTPNQTQHLIECKLEKKGRNVQYGPKQGKKGVIFIDDLNLPEKDRFESQPPLELLRQWMDHGGWYDIDSPEKRFKHIEDICFVGAMGPVSAGRQSVTFRYLRHYNVTYIENYSEKTLKGMFKELIQWSLEHSTPKYSSSLINLSESLANATVDAYLKLPKEQQLKPIPSKSHYFFNMRDVGKIFQGICRASSFAIKKEEEMIKLWAHECIKVFHDRLISQQDRDCFMKLLKFTMKTHFGKEWENVVQVEPLIFGSFVPCIYPDDDKSKEPLKNLYCELMDRQQLKAVAESFLTKYNESKKTRLEIVLFMSAIETIASILRVITLPLGHVLVIGVSGSGRKSLTTLASFIGNYQIFEMKKARKRQINEWHAELRELISKTGADMQQTVFFLSDAEITNEMFLEDINNLLNIGDVSSLYSKTEHSEGKEDILAKLKESLMAHQKKASNLEDDEVLEIVKEHSRENLHIVFAISPMCEQFRNRLRKFPSLVNCMTINWFLPWPEEALRSVAVGFLTETPEFDKEREGIVSVCVDMQERVRFLTEKYKREMQCYYYVTPTSYLELIKIFKKLFAEKRDVLKTMITTYESGLEELKTTETFVVKMRAKLDEMEPEQKQKSENAARLAELLKKKQAEATEETKVVQKEEEKASESKKIADELQSDCQADLDKAMPELIEAEKAMGTIKPDAIAMLQGMGQPPEGLIPVAKALCIVLDIKPKQVPKAEPDYWLPKKIFVFKNIKTLTKFDKNNIPIAKINELKKIIESPSFSTGKIEETSKEGEMIARWVRALVKFDQVNREVAPKKARLAEESEKAKAAQEVWANKSKLLEEKKVVLATLKQQSETAETEKKKLTQEIEFTKKKSERARDLVDMLKNENKRWKEQCNELKERYKNLLGDMLVSSGIIAYLGAFPAQYRESCINSWRELLTKLHIPISETFSLFNILGDPLQKLDWQKQKLPSDAISTDNAIIMENSNRWPLLIDPQRQAAEWIKAKDRPEIIKKSQDVEQVMKKVSSCITEGKPILLEDIDETIDPHWDSLLKKEVRKEGKVKLIKLGDESLTMSPKFMFYMTTKLPQPHYSPEVCAIVTMLNFSATEEALREQMLNIIVKKEDLATERAREEAIQKSVEAKRTLKSKEADILRLVTTQKEEILESEKLLDTLSVTKKECQQHTSRVEEQKKAADKHENARSKFRSVAKRVADLYFCVADLVKLEPMYQYSLEWYHDLYQKSMLIDKEDDQALKLNKYKKNFTHLLFTSVCKSIFEKDKLLFVLNMQLTIFISEGLNTLAEVKYFALGNSTAIIQIPSNPTGQKAWLSEKSWKIIYEMSQIFPAFKDLEQSFIKNASAWEKVFLSNEIVNQNKCAWPDGWSSQEKLNPLQRLMIIKALRPDKLIEAINNMISENLGKEFLEFPPLNLEEAYAAASNKVPILIILSPGADPLSEIKALAEKKGLLNSLVPLSLGRGQEKKADIAIDYAMKCNEGGWVIMQNCHYAISFLSNLEKKLDEIPEDPKVQFRLWLTSMPCSKFPVTLLQNSIKLTNEPPKGIQRSMLNAYSKLDPAKFADTNPKPQIMRKLMYTLTLFHCIVQERAALGSLGWNCSYEFSHSDLNNSINDMQIFLNNFSEIPWEVLRSMISERNYGGRISDPLDARCLETIVSELFTPEAMKDNYKFCKRKEYALPSDLKTRETYISYIKTLPMVDDPEVFGLNTWASSTCGLRESNNILNLLASLLPHTVISGAESQEQILAAKAKQIYAEIPQEFDIDDCTKKYPYTPGECMNSILMQELTKYNNLLHVVKQSLNNLQSAIKGDIIMTQEIEDVGNSILNDLVPQLWKANSYPSLKHLSTWTKDMYLRIKFFQDWVEKGIPSKIWISAFFYTQAFLTGILQNHARKMHIAIDSLTIESIVLSPDYDTSKPPAEGCIIYGLYIEGAKWSTEKSQLVESEGKEIYNPMQPIWIKPIDRNSISHKQNVKNF